VEVAIIAVDANTGNVHQQQQQQQQQQPSSAPASEASTAVLDIGPPAIPAVASYQSDTSHGEHSCSTASLSLNKDHVGGAGRNHNDNGSEQHHRSNSFFRSATNTTGGGMARAYELLPYSQAGQHYHPQLDSPGWTSSIAIIVGGCICSANQNQNHLHGSCRKTYAFVILYLAW
jgi:hypothetical protein